MLRLCLDTLIAVRTVVRLGRSLHTGRGAFALLRVCSSVRHQMPCDDKTVTIIYIYSGLVISRSRRRGFDSHPGLLAWWVFQCQGDSQIKILFRKQKNSWSVLPLHMNSLEQTSHRYGLLLALALLWERSWNKRFPFKGNDLPHSPQVCGLSPQLWDLETGQTISKILKFYCITGVII